MKWLNVIQIARGYELNYKLNEREFENFSDLSLEIRQGYHQRNSGKFKLEGWINYQEKE